MKVQQKKLEILYQFILGKGFEISIEDIALGINVTKKTLYNRYSSRLLLEKQVVDYWRELFQTRFDEKCAFTNNFVEQLLILIYEFELVLKQEPVFFKREIENHTDPLKLDESFFLKIVSQIITQGKGNGEFFNDINTEKYARFFLFNVTQLFFKETFPHLLTTTVSENLFDIEFEYIHYLMIPILTKQGMKNYEEIDLNLLLTM